MNQNNKNRVRDFFRKEGFYFILFLCLCVIATTIVMTTKKNNNVNQANKDKQEFSLNVEDSNVSNTLSKQNAERVENESVNSEIANDVTNEEISNNELATDEEIANNEETAQVSTTVTEVKLVLPLEGILSRSFGQMVRTKEDSGNTVDVTRRGVDLEASIDTVVKAPAEGQVTEVSSNPEDGCYVIITHANGLKTIYTNLAESVNVSTGDKVAEGDEIGKVGNTSVKYPEAACGTVLNIQVEDSNGNDLNPEDYFSF